MSELKFRAWDPTTKEMRESMPLIFPQGTIMQFTGLMDKNGREIYEGDVVRINHPHDRTGDFTGAIGKVFWWDEEGAWYHTNNNDRPPKRMWEYVEVIGNVYEHPELMEGSSDTR